VTRRVLIRPAASHALDQQAQYIAADSGIETALNFYEMADETFRLLLSHPRLGRAPQIRNRLLANTRILSLKHFAEFVVFYRPLGKGIEIVRVVHGSRDLRV
jgi:toxin ParE1/3/4